MSEISVRNELQIRTQAGRELCTKIMDLVHIKLGNKAFAEVVECEMQQLDEFFHRYINFDIDPAADFLAELTRIHGILESLPNHPDIRSFMS